MLTLKVAVRTLKNIVCEAPLRRVGECRRAVNPLLQFMAWEFRTRSHAPLR